MTTAAFQAKQARDLTEAEMKVKRYKEPPKRCDVCGGWIYFQTEGYCLMCGEMLLVAGAPRTEEPEVRQLVMEGLGS